MAPRPRSRASHPPGTRPAPSAPDACSVLWDRAGSSAYGTAATAGFFVALEQPGPWGRDALRESHLGGSLGGDLADRCASLGGRFVLLRRPGSHPDIGGAVTALLAHASVVPGRAWLLQGLLERPEQLLELDWEALAGGQRDRVAASLPRAAPAEPALLVCTNGRRDVCCALRGRPVAAAAAQDAPGRVWESSHTGGHRFAPTGVLLPWGHTVARLTETSARELVVAGAAGRTLQELLGPLHDRGRSCLAPTAQCAESAVRTELGEDRIEALWAEPDGEPAPATDIVVRHEDGRSWIVSVARRSSGDQRPESCGKPPVPVWEYTATTIRPVAAHQGLG